MDVHTDTVVFSKWPCMVNHHTIQPREVQGSLRIGCTREKLMQLEEQILPYLRQEQGQLKGSSQSKDLVIIPFDLYSSLCKHTTARNRRVRGQSRHCGGVLGETRLLSSEEILDEVVNNPAKRRALDGCHVYHTDPMQPSKSLVDMVLIPIAASFGTRQLLVDARSHAVYLRSGWNIFFQSDSILGYFHKVLDSTVQRIHTPPIPQLVYHMSCT